MSFNELEGFFGDAVAVWRRTEPSSMGFVGESRFSVSGRILRILHLPIAPTEEKAPEEKDKREIE